MSITLDMRALKGLENKATRAAAKTVDALLTEVRSAAVMPFDTGDMQNNQTFYDVERVGDEIHAHLVTGSPQARRLYYHPEYHFQRVNNANAGAHWLEPWLTGANKDFAARTFAANLKQEGL